jgi:hypothetical protein
MTCAECGKEAKFWLCSNACARAHAEKRRGVECAICSFDSNTGRIGSLETNEICAECRAHSENGAWIEARNEEPDEHIDTRLAEIARLREQQDRPLPPVTELAKKVANMIIEGESVPYYYYDKSGTKRGIRYRCRPYTVRRLAEVLGCSRRAVRREIRNIEG